jgi:hypothetical protein
VWKRFSISLQIYKNKKAHLSNKNDYIFFLSGKKLYTHDLNFFKF